MVWQERLNGDSLTWLLEPDADNPSIRYFVLRDLLNHPDDDSDVLAFTAETPAVTQVTAVTRTQSPLVLTRQADYATVDPAAHQGGGLGGGRGQHAEATPVSTIESGTATPTGANHDTSH